MDIAAIYIDKVVKGVKMMQEAKDKLKGLDPVLTGFAIAFKMDYLEVKDGLLEVTTGNKTAPAGISVTEADYVVANDGTTLAIVAIPVLKDYIRSNFKTLQKSLDEGYKNITVLIPIADIYGLTDGLVASL